MHMHYFRGFAIVNIVFAHTWIGPLTARDTLPAKMIEVVREVLFHDSTIYFLFISGFLFYYLSENFSIQKYYRSRFLNVLVPYVFLTTSIVLFRNYNPIINESHSFFYYFKLIIFTLIKGDAKIPYWYIPFISIIFFISPLILKIPEKLLIKIVLVTALLPLLGTRTGTDLSVRQYLFFFPVYLIGIYAASNYENFISAIRSGQTLLCYVVFISSAILIFIHGKFVKIGFINVSESIYYIQKIAICLLVLAFFERNEEKDIPLLGLFATYSFAIYFTHTIVSNDYLIEFYDSHILLRFPAFAIPISCLYAFITIFASLMVCVFVKKILGDRSRYIIGA
jgi:hypothetical protein